MRTHTDHAQNQVTESLGTLQPFVELSFPTVTIFFKITLNAGLQFGAADPVSVQISCNNAWAGTKLKSLFFKMIWPDILENLQRSESQKYLRSLAPFF